MTGEFLHSFFASGYVYVISAFQLIAGLLLLIGKFVPLGLTILGAIIVNIWAFHLLMAPEGLPPLSSSRFLSYFWSGHIAIGSQEFFGPDFDVVHKRLTKRRTLSCTAPQRAFDKMSQLVSIILSLMNQSVQAAVMPAQTHTIIF